MEQSRSSRPPKARLSSVANSIRLLSSFSGEENELGITVLASRLRLAKSTVHRLAATLTAARFLEQNGDTGKYRLGLALFELGALVRRRMDVADAARQKLRELLEQTGETVQLGIIDHDSVLYVYEMESRRAIRMAAAVGARATGRPVKLMLSRREMFYGVGYRPHTVQRVALGASRDKGHAAVGTRESFHDQAGLTIRVRMQHVACAGIADNLHDQLA